MRTDFGEEKRREEKRREEKRSLMSNILYVVYLGSSCLTGRNKTFVTFTSFWIYSFLSRHNIRLLFKRNENSVIIFSSSFCFKPAWHFLSSVKRKKLFLFMQ